MLDQEFKLKPSRLFIILFSIFLLVTLLIFLFLPLSFRLKLFGFILLSLYVFHIYWKFGLLRSGSAILSLKHLTQDIFQVYTANETYEATLCGDSTVTSIISILCFQRSKSWYKTSVIILPDSLDPGLYRRLVVVLKMGQG